jgi:hypothetical protein
MTYNQMTKRIKGIDTQIEFMKNIQSDLSCLSRKADMIICGEIINSLCCWKNTLIYDKEYVPKV